MEAVAAYIRTIRHARGYTQESLAEAAQTSKSTIERLERAEGELTVQTFARIVAVLGAAPEHVHALTISPTATAAEAEAMAEAWVRGASPQAGEPSALVGLDSNLRQMVLTLGGLPLDQLLDVLYELHRRVRQRRVEYLPAQRLVRRRRPRGRGGPP